MAVGNKLSQIIESKGLTQKEVADKAGISPQTLNKIIVRDSARTDIQLLLKICKALEIPVSVFADDALEEFYQDHPNAPRVEENTNYNLSKNQKRIVALFDKLTEAQQENIIGRTELLAEQNAEAGVKDTKPVIETATRPVFIAARSSDNHGAQIVDMPVEMLQRLREAPETDDEDL